MSRFLIIAVCGVALCISMGFMGCPNREVDAAAMKGAKTGAGIGALFGPEGVAIGGTAGYILAGLNALWLAHEKIRHRKTRKQKDEALNTLRTIRQNDTTAEHLPTEQFPTH